MTNRQAAVIASRVLCFWFIYEAVAELMYLPGLMRPVGGAFPLIGYIDSIEFSRACHGARPFLAYSRAIDSHCAERRFGDLLLPVEFRADSVSDCQRSGCGACRERSSALAATCAPSPTESRWRSRRRDSPFSRSLSRLPPGSRLRDGCRSGRRSASDTGASCVPSPRRGCRR